MEYLRIQSIKRPSWYSLISGYPEEDTIYRRCECNHRKRIAPPLFIQTIIYKNFTYVIRLIGDLNVYGQKIRIRVRLRFRHVYWKSFTLDETIQNIFVSTVLTPVAGCMLVLKLKTICIRKSVILIYC